MIGEEVGSPPFDILFMGEAPGKSEDLMGVPFYGPSGVLLDQMVEEVNARLHRIRSRPFSYIITNTILCRPYVEDAKSPDYLENRDPSHQEILNCVPNIMQIINIAQPKITIFVGDVSKRYWKRELPLSKSILHPSFVLRKGGRTSPFYHNNIRTLVDILGTELNDM